MNNITFQTTVGYNVETVYCLCVIQGISRDVAGRCSGQRSNVLFISFSIMLHHSMRKESASIV